MRQNQRGGKRLPYKRKRGKACCTPNSWGYLGRKPYTSRRVVSASFAVPWPPARATRPPVVPARRPACATPACRPAPCPSPWRPFSRQPCRLPRLARCPPRPRPAAVSPRPAAAPATRPVCARRGLGAPPRRFCARPGCATRRPAPTPNRSAAAAVPPAPPAPACAPAPRRQRPRPAARRPPVARPAPPAVPAPGPKGGSNLCERFPGDRRALSREFSQNCRPGVSPQKHKKRARVGTLCQQSSVYRRFFAPV